MTNKRMANTINNRFYYGWVIILMAAISIFFSAPGQTYSISTFIDSYIEDFNYSRTLISSIYSIATVISGSLLVFMGKAVDRYGQRRMLIITGTMLAIACIFNSFIGNIGMIFIGFFILRYFGQGSLTLIPGSLVPQWFERKRALSISLYTYGNILANIIVPPFNVWMISRLGWPVAWRIWSILLMLVFVPLMAVFIINKPEDIGLLPDNRKTQTDEELRNELDKMEKDSWTLNGALKTKEFWFIGIISMIAPMITTGLMFHFFSIMSLKGVGDTAASFVIGLIALPGFIMPLLASLIIDKVQPKYLMSITLSTIVLDLLFLLIVKSTLTASIFMLIYGLANSFQSVTLNVIWVKYFGRKHLGSIRGAATVFMVIGSALGPLPFGLSYDLTNGYNAVLILMAIATSIGIIMSLSIKKPIKS